MPARSTRSQCESVQNWQSFDRDAAMITSSLTRRSSSPPGYTAPPKPAKARRISGRRHMAWIISTGGRPRSHRPRLSSNDGSSLTASNAERIWSELTATRIGASFERRVEDTVPTALRARWRPAWSRQPVLPAGAARNWPVSELSARTSSAGGPSKITCAAVVARARTQVDHPVGPANDIQVVLDDDHRPSVVDQSVQQADEVVDILHVEAGGRLVEDIDLRVAGHLDRQLQPLPLAAGERVELLAEGEVPQAHIGEALEHDADRFLGEEVASLLDRHGQGLDDIPPAEAVLEDVVGVATALAHLADADDLGHEPEAGVGLAQAVAVRAGALRVRAEQRGLDAVGLCECRADRVEDAGVRRRVRAPRATDRRLVDDGHRRVGAWQAAMDQRALARAGHAGHRDEHAERDVDGDVLQVVQPGVPDRDRAARRTRLRLQLLPQVEVAAGGRPGRDEAIDACPRTRRSRRGGRRRGPCRRRGRRSGSPPRRARPRGPCCPCRAGVRAGCSSAGRRAHAGRWSARRRHT